jgi:hypothetical protein
MDAPGAVCHVAFPHAEAPVVPRLARAAIITLYVFLALAVALICARRAGGALSGPLPSTVLMVLALALGGAALAFRNSFAARMIAARWPVRYALCAAPSLVLLLAATGLLLPGTPTVGMLGFLGVLLAEEGWSWGRMFPANTPGGRFGVAAVSSPAAGRTDVDEPRPGAAMLDEPPEESEDGTTQSMNRRRDAAGHETIEGYLRVGFESAQRNAIAHVAICPPFSRTPVCYAEPSSGPDAQVKVAQVLPHGVRLEIKLDQPAREPADVTVEFSIQEQPAEA